MATSSPAGYFRWAGPTRMRVSGVFSTCFPSSGVCFLHGFYILFASSLTLFGWPSDPAHGSSSVSHVQLFGYSHFFRVTQSPHSGSLFDLVRLFYAVRQPALFAFLLMGYVSSV